MSSCFQPSLATEIHAKGISASFWECVCKGSVRTTVLTTARSTVLVTPALVSLYLPRKGWWQQAAGVKQPNVLQWSHQASSRGVVTLAPSTGGSLAQDITQKYRRGMQMLLIFFSIAGVYLIERDPTWHFSCNTLWLLYSSPNFNVYLALNTPNCTYIYHSNSFGSVLYRLLCYFCTSQYAKEIAEMLLWAPFQQLLVCFHTNARYHYKVLFSLQ